MHRSIKIDGSEDLYFRLHRCDSIDLCYATRTLAGRPLALKKDSSSRFPEILKQGNLKKEETANRISV